MFSSSLRFCTFARHIYLHNPVVVFLNSFATTLWASCSFPHFTDGHVVGAGNGTWCLTRGVKPNPGRTTEVLDFWIRKKFRAKTQNSLEKMYLSKQRESTLEEKFQAVGGGWMS